MTSKTSRPRAKAAQASRAGDTAKIGSAIAETTIGSAAVSAVIERARGMGLLTAGTQQVGARLPTRLLQQAKRRTGIESMTDLLAFALANVAIEDDFATAFVSARGKLDPDLDIGF